MANPDLQQYNGTASFPSTADAGTNADPLLLPTDGPIVAADSNLASEAPVNVSLRRFKDLVLGIRDAIVGDRVGAAQKTQNRSQIDGFGGLATSIAAGEQEVASHITSLTGDITTFGAQIWAKTAAGLVIAGQPLAQRLEHSASRLRWLVTGTGATDANPPQGTPLPNVLVAKNTLKYYMRVSSTAGTVTAFDGHGHWLVGIVDIGMGNPIRYRMRFTLLGTALDNITYAVTAQWYAGNSLAANAHWMPVVMTDTLAVNSFDIAFVHPDNVTPAALDLSSGDAEVAVHVHGQQTT